MSVAAQVLQALTGAASPDQNQRRAAEDQLAQLKANNHAFLTACTQIFVSTECALVGRQLAGLQLKNAITAVMNANNTHPMTPFFVNNAELQMAICMQGLQDSHRVVRNVAASIVSWAVYANLWPPEQTVGVLVGEIIQKPNTNVLAVHGAMRALSQIVSDCLLLLESRSMMGPILQVVTPFLTRVDYFTAEFSQPMPPPGAGAGGAGQVAIKDANRDAIEVRGAAFDIATSLLDRCAGDPDCGTFAAVAPLVPTLIQAFLVNVHGLETNRYLYFSFAAKACGCLVGLIRFHENISDEMFLPVLQSIFTVTASAESGDAALAAAGVYIADNEREKLGIEAMGFWSTILNVPRFAAPLAPALENLIYYLIRQMTFTGFEMGMLCANANDWSVPDKIDDVRPRHYAAKTQSTAHKRNKSIDNSINSSADGSGDGNTNSNNDANDDDDDDDDDEVQEWNLRRVSALTLDDLAENFGDGVVLPVLKWIEGMMQPGQPWKDLEAAVLAVGCICDGCFDSLRPYLPALAARFIAILEDSTSHFLVVNTTIWVCTQIGRYFVEGGDGRPEGKQAFHRVMRLILGKMQSPSKSTQESATEALETMVGLCGEWGSDAVAMLDPLAPEILNTVAACVDAYQLKNKVLLFDVLRTICEVMGETFQANPGASEVILAPLGKMWTVIPNDNPLVFSFFTCMGTVCAALGGAVQPMAEQIFDRAFTLINYHVNLRGAAFQRLSHQSQQAGHQGKPSIMVFDDTPDTEYLVTAADLLSGLFSALGSSLEPLVAARQPGFSQAVLAMLTDPECYRIRESGFALLGDLAKGCVSHAQTCLAPAVQAAVQNLQEFQQLQQAKAGVHNNNHSSRDSGDGGGDGAELMYRVVSNIAWYLCNLLESELDINGLPTLATVSPQAVPQLFTGLATALCSSSAELPKSASNMAENTVLCLGMLLAADPDLEAKTSIPVSSYAAPFLHHVRNIKEDLPHRGPALQGFLLAVQSSPSGPQALAASLTSFFDLAVKMHHDSPDLVRAMKQLLTSAKQAAPQVWAQRMAAYGTGMKTQLYRIYGLN